MATLLQMVNALQSERDALAAQIHAEKTGLSRRAGHQGTGQGKIIPAHFVSGWETDTRIYRMLLPTETTFKSSN